MLLFHQLIQPNLSLGTLIYEGVIYFQLLKLNGTYCPLLLSTFTTSKINFVKISKKKIMKFIKRSCNYSTKNISLPSERLYKMILLEKYELVIEHMRWKAHLYESNSYEATNQLHRIFKSRNCPPQHKGLIQFKNDFIDFSSARVKICEVRVNFKTTSQFLLNFCVTLHCHDTQLHCKFEAHTFSTLDKRSYQSSNFDTFECSGENLQNSSCHFPSNKPVFLRILHHSSVP